MVPLNPGSRHSVIELIMGFKWLLAIIHGQEIIKSTFRQNICFYISVVIRPYIYRVNISPKLKSWNITYMDRYMPLVGIYWSIYVILKWFKRSGLILTDICNGLITPDIWKHIWSEYVCIYRTILKYIERYMKILINFHRYMYRNLQLQTFIYRSI